MKTSELMQIVAKNILPDGKGSIYICNEINNVLLQNQLSLDLGKKAKKRIMEYISLPPGLREPTFTVWLNVVTGGASSITSCNLDNLPEYRIIQFLRSMLCETIAKEFESIGD